MRNFIAMAAVLLSVACGSGTNDVATLPSRAQAAIIPDGACTGDPSDCGTKVCVDCTAATPPGRVAACVRGDCQYP